MKRIHDLIFTFVGLFDLIFRAYWKMKRDLHIFVKFYAAAIKPAANKG